MKNLFHKAKRYLSGIHPKKSHVEFITALLSIPVLLTVILVNVNNLNAKNKAEEEATSKKNEIIISLPPTIKEEKKDTPQCKPDIGPIDISYPHETDTVSDNPLNIDINYTSEGYCAVVWSYRINNGSWSDYDDKSIALYNMSSGDVKFELRVKSLISGKEKFLTRNFTYKSSIQPTPTPTITPTMSPTPTPTGSN
ncbi:MAG: hypothetical protein HYT10_01970 [Candidatus Levybacteria bacterium]|nr:hypothetical protein [Candidatus Levybacteria bacterium]